jgi:hypothetical protein
MNRNQAKELLPIIKAFSEGKVIESRCIKGDTSLWYDDKDPSFDDDFEYRIKPEPKYRPFAKAEECWQEMLKHQPFGWVKDRNGSKFLIENVDSRGFVEVYDEGTCTFKEVFENRTFADGTPFGIKKEE